MTLEIPAKQLKQAVQGLSRVAPRNPTLPILSSVRFQAHEGMLSATSTDLDQYARYHFDTPCSDQDTFVIAMKELASLTQADSDSRIQIEIVNPNQISVTRQVAGRGLSATLDTIDPSEWPELPATVKTQSVNDAFLENIRRLIPFATDDASRHVLNSVFLDVSQASHFMVATDGRRLTSLNTVTLPFKESHILPTRKFLSWSKLEGPLALGLSKVNEAKWIQLDAGPWTYLTRTVDGTYPNWRQVVPSSRGSHAIVFNDEDVSLMGKVFPTLAGADNGQA